MKTIIVIGLTAMPSIPKKFMDYLALSAIAFFLISCRSYDDLITWVYIIPDGYIGWLAIQHDCPNGQPLDRQGNVIRVPFDSDGLFCTTDPFFPWTGQTFAQDQSGNEILVIGRPRNNRGYAVCCGQTMGINVDTVLGQTDITIQIVWAGNMENGDPPLNLATINDNARSGKLVPASW